MASVREAGWGSNREVADLTDRYIMRTYGRFPIAPVRGQGCRLWDADGKVYLDFVAGLYHVDGAVAASRRGELLEMFDLQDWANELIESYSHGMKQRLVMAAALIHAPRLLIVDEPMVGLDPRGARLLKHTFTELAREGVTVFMSTHSLGVAEETCDRIGIINQGRLIAVGTVDELRELAGSHADARLEAIFLRLTCGEDVADRLAALRA